MAVARDAVRPVQLPQEVVPVDPIGGEVIVRGFDMPQLLRFYAARRAAAQPRDGESEPQAQERAAGELVPMALHMAVVLDDGLPVYTEAEWRTFGGQHAMLAMDLFARVMRLSGAELDAEKKT